MTGERKHLWWQVTKDGAENALGPNIGRQAHEAVPLHGQVPELQVDLGPRTESRHPPQPLLVALPRARVPPARAASAGWAASRGSFPAPGRRAIAGK